MKRLSLILGIIFAPFAFFRGVVCYPHRRQRKCRIRSCSNGSSYRMHDILQAKKQMIKMQKPPVKQVVFAF